MVKSEIAQLDLIFHALADSTRRSILHSIANKEKTVSQIANPYRMSLAAVSKHLKVLQAANLIGRRKEGSFRMVRLNADALRSAEQWISYYQQFWSDPNILKQWFAPGALSIPTVKVDFREGGSYLIAMTGEMRGKQTSGNISGTYKKISPESLLIFTFKGTWQDSALETLVTVEFRDVEGGTEINLNHERFASAQNCESHTLGWESTLSKLAKFYEN